MYETRETEAKTEKKNEREKENERKEHPGGQSVNQSRVCLWLRS